MIFYRFFILFSFVCLIQTATLQAYEIRVLDVGQADAFNPDPDVPSVNPSIGLKKYTTNIFGAYPDNRSCDDFRADRYFSHTFTDFAVTNKIVFDANLHLSIAPISYTSAIPHNDTISIGFIDENAQQLSNGWMRQIGTYEQNNEIIGLLPCNWGTDECNGSALTPFDLSALPLADAQTISVLEALNQHKILDLMVQDDTAVDYARLELKYCNDNMPNISPQNITLSPNSEITFHLLATGSDVNQITAAIQVNPNVMTHIDSDYGDFFDPDNRSENPVQYSETSGIWMGDAGYYDSLHPQPKKPFEQEGTFASIKFKTLANTYGEYTLVCLNMTFLNDLKQSLRGSDRFSQAIPIIIDDGIHGGSHTISGQILCPEGIPEDVVKIRIMSDQGNMYSAETFFVDNEIHYSLPEIREGAFTLKAYAPGFLSDPLVLSITESQSQLTENISIWDKTCALTIEGNGQVWIGEQLYDLPFQKRYPKNSALSIKPIPVCDFNKWTGSIDSETGEQIILLDKSYVLSAHFDHPEFLVEMNVEGMDIGGTRLCDLSFGVGAETLYLDAPMEPPVHSVYAVLYTVSGEGPFSKIIYPKGESIYEWILTINPHGNIDPPGDIRTSVIRWNPASFPDSPCWYFRLREGSDGNGKIIVPDMRKVSEVEISGPDEYLTYTIEMTQYMCMSLDKGWSLIGLPVIPNSTAYTNLFPDANVIYTFDQQYVNVKHMEPGKGYWIKVPDAKTYHLYGPPNISYQLPKKKGWSLIGGGYNTTRATTDPQGCIGIIYGFGYRGYFLNEENILQSGKGYWLKIEEDCQFIVSPAIALKSSSEPEEVPSLPVTIEQGTGSILSYSVIGKYFGLLFGKTPKNIKEVSIKGRNGIQTIRTYYGWFCTMLQPGEYVVSCGPYQKSVSVQSLKTNRVYFNDLFLY
jgi:hypothetical protein